MLEIVLDTNVLFSGLRSRQGASFRLLSLVGTGRFGLVLSVPLVFEYESVLLRRQRELGLTGQEIADVLDYLCSVGRAQDIFYLWRPCLRDPKDDMVLEVAVAAACRHVVTFNRRDFAGAERFGIEVLDPRSFLDRIGEHR